MDSELDLPHSDRYGDGAPTGPDDLDEVRRAAGHSKLGVLWQAGDLMVVDIMPALHGREPFTGTRRAVVSMT